MKFNEKNVRKALAASGQMGEFQSLGYVVYESERKEFLYEVDRSRGPLNISRLFYSNNPRMAKNFKKYESAKFEATDYGPKAIVGMFMVAKGKSVVFWEGDLSEEPPSDQK